MDKSRCPACGQANLCGITAGDPGCWCMQQPALNNTPQDGQSCWCQACLAKQFNAPHDESTPTEPAAN